MPAVCNGAGQYGRIASPNGELGVGFGPGPRHLVEEPPEGGDDDSQADENAESFLQSPRVRLSNGRRIEEEPDSDEQGS